MYNKWQISKIWRITQLNWIFNIFTCSTNIAKKNIEILFLIEIRILQIKNIFTLNL
jgi:hypothetical protein